MDQPTILTSAETAEVLNVPVATLRWWRHTGAGPRSFKLGPKKVAYKRQDVLDWIEEQYNADEKVGA